MTTTFWRTSWVPCVFGTAVLLAANWPVLHALVQFARGNPTASHVVLVPIVTLVLLYQDRATVFSSPRPAWRSGLGVIVAGICLSLVGRLFDGSLAQQDALGLRTAGVVVSCVGLFVACFGWQASRAAAFPLLFLAFAIPMPTIVVEAATEFLKKGSTETVAAVFMLTGTPFHRDGFVFSLPHFTIEVADECSGIRSSIALLLTGVLAGHALLRRSWTQGLLLLAIVPVAVLKNGIRIASLSLLAIHVDPSFLVGQLHHEGGVVFFLVALAMLAPLLPLLRRLETRRAPAQAIVTI